METTLRETPAPTSGPRARLPYVGGLDGLRAVCLLAIFCYHAEFGWAEGAFLSVSTFFTLSGFLITALLLIEMRSTGRVDLGRFWSARGRRLLPAAGLTLLLVIAFARFGATSTQLTGLRQDLWASLGVSVNWRLAFAGRTYEGAALASPVQHLWTLAVEEQFYLVLPVLSFLAVRVSRRRGVSPRAVVGTTAAVLAVASTLLLWRGGRPGADLTWTYFTTHSRAAELLAGVILACVVHRLVGWKPRRWLVPVLSTAAGLGILAAWAFAHQTSPRTYGGGITLYTLGSVLVIVGCLSPGPVRAVLDTAVLREIGKVSYGAYLYHWPLFSWLRPDTVGLDGYPLFAVRVGATLVLAFLSAHFVELPIRRRQLLPHVQPLALGAVVLLAVASTWLVPWRTTDTGPSGVVTAEGERVQAAGGGDASVTTPATEPDAPRVEHLLMVGDSIIEQLAPYAAEALPGVDVRYIGGGGIGPLADQADMARQLQRMVDTFDPDMVVFEFSGNYLRLRPQAVPYVTPDGIEVGDATDLMYEVWRDESARLVDIADQRGATPIWALTPTIDRDATFGFLADGVPRLNAGYRTIDVELLDWFGLTGGDDGFQEELTDEDGDTEDARSEDGVHFTAFGNRILAATLAERIARWEGRSPVEDGG